MTDLKGHALQFIYCSVWNCVSIKKRPSVMRPSEATAMHYIDELFFTILQITVLCKWNCIMIGGLGTVDQFKDI